MINTAFYFISLSMFTMALLRQQPAVVEGSPLFYSSYYRDARNVQLSSINWVNTLLTKFEIGDCFNHDGDDCNDEKATTSTTINRRGACIDQLRGGGLSSLVPAGYNPFGHKITPLGLQFLEKFDGSLESDVGRFLASMKTTRKRFDTIKSQWLEIVRVSKKGQSMRIYKNLQRLIDFCLAAKLLD